MINNHWEELNETSTVLFKKLERQNLLLEKMNFPSWLKNINCPFCVKQQPYSYIRQVGFKLNPRNMGDIFVEVCCYDCGKMDVLYFKSEIEKISDFMGFLDGTKIPKSPPIVEAKMYEMRYNNMIEIETRSKKCR